MAGSSALANGKFLGIEWSVWKVVGWIGNAVFSTRFLVQWYATEKRQQVVVPPLFWWLSLAGSLLLLSYALFYQRDSVFIFAYAFTWIPYMPQPAHPSPPRKIPNPLLRLRAKGAGLR